MAGAVLCDLDGVIWLGDEPIPGSREAVERLRAAGRRVLFVTNFSFDPVEAMERKLARHGIEAAGDVVTSAQAAAHLIQPGERVLVCAGPGVVEAVERRGGEVVTDGRVDAVIVGFHRSFDFAVLERASTAARDGARLIGTNDDATYPTPNGPIPGGGAILAAVAVASGVVPIVAGKPHEPMAALVRDILGASDGGADLASTVMVGDRPSTDGAFAATLGCRYAQVWSGVVARGTMIDPAPDVVADDLAALADLMIGTS
jgi:4-nitrophenyl phosphatase